jgi:hypothetical protein
MMAMMSVLAIAVISTLAHPLLGRATAQAPADGLAPRFVVDPF